MKHIHNISIVNRLILILLMSVSALCVSAQMTRDVFYDAAMDSDVQVKDYTDAQRAKIYEHTPPLGVKYTKKHPLVIVGNWTFKPYSFVNDHGEPDGFQVDMLKQIFTNIHVPYTLQLMDWKTAKQMVLDGRAQLMVGIDTHNVTPHTSYSKCTIAEYKICVLQRRTTKKIRSILLLTKEDTVYVNKGDYVDVYLKQYFGTNPPFVIEYMGPDDAFVKIYKGTIKYYISGALPLRDLVKKYGEEDEMRIDEIDIPSGRMRFFSNDSILLHELDMQFQHIKAMQFYEPLCKKWFDNDGRQEESTTMGQVTLIVLGVIFIVVFIIALIMIQRSGSSVNLKTEFRTISNMAISMTRCSVLCIDVRRMWVTNVSGSMLPPKGVSMHEYEGLIHPDDIQTEYDIRKRVDSGEKDMPIITLRIRPGVGRTDEWRIMNVAAIVRSNSNGMPKRVYLIFTDETEHIQEQMKLDMALREFADIHQIKDYGLLYYDASGQFVNSNPTIIEIFDQGGLGRAEQYLKNTRLQDFPVILNGIAIEPDMNAWFCAPIDIPELNIKITVEVRIISVYDDNGELNGYEICAKDITIRKNVLSGQRELRQRMLAAKKRLMRLHMELRFILRKNKISTFRWQRGNDFFEISRDLLSFDRRSSFQDTLNNMILEDKGTLIRAISDPDEYFSRPHNDIFCYKNVNTEGGKIWMHTFLMPNYDAAGNLTGAFGIQCDITDMQQSQENLRKETEKAENSGKLKTLFMANMTHELRTPLNAINGFAEVMMFMDSDDEKEEYIGIMRHNCTMLINLVDNILQLSVMDTDGLKLHRRNVDFAQLFPGTVSEMKKYITSPDVKLQIDTPYATLPLEVDYERIMQVVDAFVNNASKFTKKGFIRVGYRYVYGVLTIYCRDTGTGIPEDKQKAVFERFVKLDDFVQGTGLGLAVCKTIADRMGATINIYSRVGEGTNFSFQLEC